MFYIFMITAILFLLVVCACLVHVSPDEKLKEDQEQEDWLSEWYAKKHGNPFWRERIS